MMQLLVLAAIAWFFPERTWPRFAALLGAFRVPASTERFRRRTERVEGWLRAHGASATPEVVVKKLVAAKIESVIQCLSQYRLGGWQPEIRLVGTEHVETARSLGRGVVLWVSPFVYHSLVTKMAFRRAGYSVSHLSSPSHGFSSTRFGMRCLNRVLTIAEDRSLEARVLLEGNNPARAIKTLRRKLRTGGVVSFTAVESGSRLAEPRFLGGKLRLALGAPSLAWKADAALLPVFAIRAPSGRFTVTFAQPIRFAPDADKGEATRAAAQRYAEDLEPYVVAHPEQWTGWLAHVT